MSEVRQHDRFLGWLARTSRSTLLSILVVSYFVPVGLFAILYSVFDLTNGHNLTTNLYFSLITQATVGYGDVLPVGLGRTLASLQVMVGVAWTAFLPALVFIRVVSPHEDTLRASRYVAFDPEARRFRFKIVNTGRFVGSRVHLQAWFRFERADGVGQRTLPLLMRSGAPAESRFPHLRPMEPTGYLTDRCTTPDLPASFVPVALHPAHLGRRRVVILDVAMETTVGTVSQTFEFSRDRVVCGSLLDVQPHGRFGPTNWSNFDEISHTTATLEGRVFCRSCLLRPTCNLVSKAADEEAS